MSIITEVRLWLKQKKALFFDGFFWILVVVSLFWVFFLFAPQLSALFHFSPFVSDIFIQFSTPMYRVLFLAVVSFAAWRYGIKPGLAVCLFLGILMFLEAFWNNVRPNVWIDFVAVPAGILLLAIVGRQGEVQNRLKKTSLELERQSQKLREEISKHQRTEEKLLFKNALLEAQSEATLDGIIAVNEKGEIVLCNRRFQEMWRIPVNLIETGMNELVFRHMILQTEDPSLLFGNSQPQLLARTEKDRQEIKINDGRVFDAYSSLLVDATGLPRGGIWFFRDITDSKEMEQRMVITDRLASIGELVSGVAHELNNPLTGIIAFSQLIMEKDIDNDLREDLSVINSEAQRTSRIIRDLLTFARKHSAVKEPARLNSVIEDVLRLRAYEHKTSNIEVIREMDPDLPDAMVDYHQIQQVILNLVINAEYFMVKEHKKGQLTIKTERKDGFIRSSITDDGPGIPEENLNRIFDPFFTTKEVGKGTGLGLSICHGIVAEHNGRIYARNIAGKGASFIVDLPVAIAVDKDPTNR
jgi:signal transduction histidine kinase